MPPPTADTETHVAAALDAAWSSSGGDWENLVSMLKKQFFDDVSSCHLSRNN